MCLYFLPIKICIFYTNSWSIGNQAFTIILVYFIYKIFICWSIINLKLSKVCLQTNLQRILRILNFIIFGWTWIKIEWLRLPINHKKRIKPLQWYSTNYESHYCRGKLRNQKWKRTVGREKFYEFSCIINIINFYTDKKYSSLYYWIR